MHISEIIYNWIYLKPLIKKKYFKIFKSTFNTAIVYIACTIKCMVFVIKKHIKDFKHYHVNLNFIEIVKTSRKFLPRAMKRENSQ